MDLRFDPETCHHCTVSFWEPCWACRLLAGEHCGEVVLETGDVFVAINPFASTPGHCLVMPTLHVPNVYELPDSVAGPIMSTAALVSRAIRYAFRAEGITLRQNNGAASDQHLFHFHLHVIPRFEGDTARFGAPAVLWSLCAQKEMASRVQGALAR